MAQLIKCSPQKYEYLDSDTQYPYVKPDMAACACNPSGESRDRQILITQWSDNSQFSESSYSNNKVKTIKEGYLVLTSVDLAHAHT